MSWLPIKYYFILECVLWNLVYSFDYCSIPCGEIKHTMCEYPEDGGPECADYNRKLSGEEIQIILDKHNELRQQVAIGNLSRQPSASDMLKMDWNNDAARTAQRWAVQCKLVGHDKCRSSQDGVSGGQNIAWKGSTIPFERKGELSRMVQSWYDEHVDLDPANVNKFNSVPPVPATKMVGHYTQVVWASSSHVGCGFAALEKGNKNDYKLVCNYFPAGNFIDNPMYKKGKACSKCPDNTKCSKRWPGLCTSDKSDFGDGKIPEVKGGSPQVSNPKFNFLNFTIYFPIHFITFFSYLLLVI